MDSRYQELQKYLPGLEPGMPKEFGKLAEIFEHQVFELCRETDAGNQADYLIPYMMNDAVEDYLVLRDCSLVGEYLAGEGMETTAHLAVEQNGYVLIVRQNGDNVFTLHFERLEERLSYYQYHRIGHFWVKGQEHWRQLVYMIGTIYDKYEYMGETACNEKERGLLKLIEFAPIRRWSPIHESLEGRYPATYEGIDEMEKAAQEAGDISFVKWIHLYRRIPTCFMEWVLSRKFLSPKREMLYQSIYEKVKAASETYPVRDYGKKRNEEIKRKREEVHSTLTAKGFKGKYPEYQKGATQVFVTEEHPFTIMEFENFVFRMQFMVSECKKCKQAVRNCGFFKGRGRSGWIAEKIEEL